MPKRTDIHSVLINSNPATIMTDPEFADRTYIEPITPECVEKIIVREKEEIAKLVGQASRLSPSKKNKKSETGLSLIHI